MANIAPQTFVDDLGRKIFLAKPPTRIVSLAPNITETLFALGVGDKIVGVTSSCDYPAEATRKAKVGDVHPNLEAVVAQRPDLVLTLPLQTDVLSTLEHLKIPVFMLDAAPPPMPISMPGPPICTRRESAGTPDLNDCSAGMDPTPPASMIGL